MKRTRALEAQPGFLLPPRSHRRVPLSPPAAAAPAPPGVGTHQLADVVTHRVNDLLPDGGVPTGAVVGRILLARDQLLGLEELPVRPRGHLGCGESRPVPSAPGTPLTAGAPLALTHGHGRLASGTPRVDSKYSNETVPLKAKLTPQYC